jgi:hypothetical protein
VVEQGIVRAVGYMTHGELTMLYAAIVLAAFPCNDAFALRPSRHGPRDPVLYRAPLVAGGLTLCLTYALCAAHRFDDRRARHLPRRHDPLSRRAARRRARRPRPDGDRAPWLGWIILVGFPVSTFFELLSPLALFHRSFRYAGSR